MKILLSLLAALVAGLLIGYIPSKILIALSLEPYSLYFSIAIGMLSAVCAGAIGEWSRKYMMGTICAFLIGSIAYYNFLYHNYLPIKRNPPEDVPALVALKTTKEPQGFFTYLQVAGGDTITTYGGRRRGMEETPQIVSWVVEGLLVLFLAFFGMTGWLNRED